MIRFNYEWTVEDAASECGLKECSREFEIDTSLFINEDETILLGLLVSELEQYALSDVLDLHLIGMVTCESYVTEDDYNILTIAVGHLVYVFEMERE